MRRLWQTSLLWRILFSTWIAITILFAITGVIVQGHATALMNAGLQDEVRTSFEAYQSIWRARAALLSSISLVLSRMPDVRAAFSTGDRATISDTAGEIWSKISREDAMFFVTDPNGGVIASLGKLAGQPMQSFPAVRAAAAHFPAQASGFMMHSGNLFHIVITPVYVESPRGPGLLTVLVAGYPVDSTLALRLKQETGGSDFVFTSGGKVQASSFRPGESPSKSDPHRQTELLDLSGQPIGELRIFRSIESARQHLSTLRRDIFWVWAVALFLGLGLTYILARRVLKPVEILDHAAVEIGRGNYEQQIPLESEDELGRLARTFNEMCSSIRAARDELVRQERITTIGRLSTSLVHDLRNPLAAIYGGAEMLVDSNLSEAHVKRLAANIYKSSRRVQELLQSLSNAGLGRSEGRETWRVKEIVNAALEVHHEAAEALNVRVTVELPATEEVVVERTRVERVFSNLFLNAIEAMPRGGEVRITSHEAEGSVVVTVADNGPGISPEIAPRLFQPFATTGKKNGLGLGLAMSRQTILEQGGDLTFDKDGGPGARFYVKLPLAKKKAARGD